MNIEIGIKLRELRRLRGWTQGEVSERCGLGVKTISSFETGNRAKSMKMKQLEALLSSYDITIEQFFGPQLEAMLFESDTDTQTEELVNEMRTLPSTVRKNLVPWLRSVVRSAVGDVELAGTKQYPQIRDGGFDSFSTVDQDWDLLVCPN